MPTDKLTLWDHLEKARQHVANGERRMASQRELIAELERDGDHSVVREAGDLLQKMEDLQQSYVRVLIVLEIAFARTLN